MKMIKILTVIAALTVVLGQNSYAHGGVFCADLQTDLRRLGVAEQTIALCGYVGRTEGGIPYYDGLVCGNALDQEVTRIVNEQLNPMSTEQYLANGHQLDQKVSNLRNLSDWMRTDETRPQYCINQ